jgi:hypothetical protein
MRISKNLSLTGLVCLLLVAACDSKESPTPTPEPVEQSGPPKGAMLWATGELGVANHPEVWHRKSPIRLAWRATQKFGLAYHSGPAGLQL